MDMLINKANGILTIEFNRVERKNAITGAMYQVMADALVDAERDTAVRAILIAGKPEIFTAGNDLDDFMKNSAPVPGVPLKHGISVTDACIGFAQTVPVLQGLAAAVRARRRV